MADQPAFTQADVDSLGQKLTQFKQTLTTGEVAAMAAVFQSGIPDVQGYAQGRGEGIFVPPLTPLVGIFPIDPNPKGHIR